MAHARGMDEKAIRRAALVTVRQAILGRFPPGPERRKWLRWLATKAPPHRQRGASFVALSFSPNAQ